VLLNTFPSTEPPVTKRATFSLPLSRVHINISEWWLNFIEQESAFFKWNLYLFYAANLTVDSITA